MANTRADVTVAMAVDGEDQVTKAINRVGNQMEKTAKATNKASGQMKQQFRFMRGGMGQLGYQVQDIAVQLQSGQNAMIVFGQQGSQIASIFGPQGAVIGAFLAVGAAIGTSLLPSLFKVNEIVKESAIDAKALAEEYNTLSSAQKSVVSREVLNNIDALNEKIAENQEQIEILEGKNIKAFVSEQILAEYRERNAEQINELTAQNEEYTRAIDKQNKIIDESSNYTEELIERLQRERQEYLMTERQISITTAVKKGATEEDIKRINTLYDQAEAYDALIAGIQEEQDALDEADKRRKKRDKDRQKREEELQNFFDEANEAQEKNQLQSMNNLATAMSSQVSQMQSVFDQASGVGKAFFVASQALAAGQAVISGLVSKMNIIKNATALGLDPGTATALGTTAEVMGYATAGAIMGQTIASFEGGGSFKGVRSGGMDGKGGRMAMVHPNEKITDLEKDNGTASVNVNFTINANDTKGFDELLRSRRGEIITIINKALNNKGKAALA